MLLPLGLARLLQNPSVPAVFCCRALSIATLTPSLGDPGRQESLETQPGTGVGNGQWFWHLVPWLRAVQKAQPRVHLLPLLLHLPNQAQGKQEQSRSPAHRAGFAVSRLFRGSPGFPSFFFQCLRLRSMQQYSINRLAWRMTKQENVIQIKVTLWLK